MSNTYPDFAPFLGKSAYYTPDNNIVSRNLIEIFRLKSGNRYGGFRNYSMYRISALTCIAKHMSDRAKKE